MARHLHVSGYEECMQAIREASEARPADALFVLFVGSKTSDGQSWCPDCRTGEETIYKFLPKLPPEVTLLEVDVGARSYWKNLQNPFRTDRQLRLTSVPTLMLWNKNVRLVEMQCSDRDLVQMFFEEALQ